MVRRRSPVRSRKTAPLRRQRLGSASMMNPLRGCFLFVDKFVDRGFSGYIIKLKGKIIDAKVAMHVRFS